MKAKYDEDEIVYKIYHKPTGLYYSPNRGRFDREKTNLSINGKSYYSHKVVEKIFNEDCRHAEINDAQLKKFGCQYTNLPYNRRYCRHEDFVIKKFILREI